MKTLACFLLQAYCPRAEKRDLQQHDTLDQLR